MMISKQSVLQNLSDLNTDEDKIIIKKYNPGCQCCGDMKDVKEYKGIKICKKCLNELNNK